jgi:hypothetical protein
MGNSHKNLLVWNQLATSSYCFGEAITTNFIATGLTDPGIENGTTPNCNNLFLHISSGSKCCQILKEYSFTRVTL